MEVLGDWLLTPQRAAVHRPTATAVIADLHLGYDQARRQHGDAVPEINLGNTLVSLSGLAQDHGVRRLVIAGDLFEDGRLGGPALELFEGLETLGLELAAVVPGNHDRGLPTASAGWPIYPDGFALGRWHVIHGDEDGAGSWQVHGHSHPCLRCRGIPAAPCFLVGPRHLVLPAFSADAAGVSVLGQKRWSRYRCCAIAADRVIDFGKVAGLRHKIMSRK